MVSDRINTREKAYIYSTLFAALIVQLQLFKAILITAACTGFVHVVESGYRPARSFRPTEHIQPGTLMSNSILVTYWATCFGHMQLFAAICWLLCCSCLHRVCAACPHQVQAAGSLR
jgi:hypothetical protein